MTILLNEPVTATSALADLLGAYARRVPPRTVAVVGNAPLPADPARAAAIDACDLVIRMTSFTVDPTALGTRTDVVVLHRGVIASPHTFADYTSRLYLLVEPGRLHWEPETIPDWWPADLGFVPIPNREFTVPLNALLGLDSTAPTWPTTGTLTTYLVTELFPDASVLLTGTSIIDSPDQTTFPHAWGAPVAVTPEHRLRAEATLLHHWSTTGRIELLP
ncbi:hypothetical protein [Actinokineospora diospyrosa]|uniref:Uncharacterized protein n=1 Tax=Actinokineospora diospyrosa TaxID=103728 RepID=A0ABT1ID75_9PSEU|nr:hypothetical protein [Actinokineospora diospyrosa]MCP2270577.1 hypothetical protein [Actinokineospora diospyrosa]